MNCNRLFGRLLLAAILLTPGLAPGQTSLDEIRATPEKAGGVYYAYPVTESLNTPAPKGYKPFYISHYGRHGSRYLISDNDYKVVLDRLHDAAAHNALTPFGLDVMARLDTVWLEARGRGGELTPLGNRQHHDIATRMYRAFPEVFAPGADLYASSTVVMRCAHSMFAFIEGLKEQDPTLVIPRESGQRNMCFLNYHSPESGPFSSHEGPWYQTWKRFRDAQTHPERLVASIFSDPAYVATWVDPDEFMWQMYWLAVDMQNMETPIKFTDVFTPEELYDLWQVFNFNFFACNSSYAPAGGHFTANAKNLARDIIANADACIADKDGHGATFRFGHDGNIIPLTALLRLDNCYTDETDPARLASVWTDFKISPMASNLQIIFFKNRSGDIIAKIMLNEREIALPLATDNFPFYPWPALRDYLVGISE
ncbi:MAG: histidine-type phosphatase [Bacteroidales bacterium]|nr:histidine-type phosphatase [Bacteroidales bacterium]